MRILIVVVFISLVLPSLAVAAEPQEKLYSAYLMATDLKKSGKFLKTSPLVNILRNEPTLSGLVEIKDGIDKGETPSLADARIKLSEGSVGILKRKASHRITIVSKYQGKLICLKAADSHPTIVKSY